jgi:hypothetical protein
LFVALGWVLFRTESLDGAFVIFDGMRNSPQTLPEKIGFLERMFTTIGFRFEGPYLSAADYVSIVWLAFWFSVLWLIPNTQQCWPVIDRYVTMIFKLTRGIPYQHCYG